MTNRYLGVDPMLTNTAIGYQNDAYIASQIFTRVPVLKQSGKHFVYDRGRFRIEDSKRGQGAPSNEVTHNLTTGNPYFCEDHVLKEFVADEDVDNAITPTSPYIDATENVTDKLLVGYEKEVADLITSTANLTQNVTLAGTDQWSDFSNSDPFDDIETGKATVHSAIGVNPNTLVMGKQVWDKLKHHPALLERVKYTQRGFLTTEIVAAAFEVDRVLIGGAHYVSSDEGQTESTSYVWGKDVVLAYIAPTVRPKIMTLGIGYEWNGHSMKVERLRGSNEEDRKGIYVRVGDWYYDTNIVAATAGYLLKSVVA